MDHKTVLFAKHFWFKEFLSHGVSSFSLEVKNNWFVKPFVKNAQRNQDFVQN